MTRKRDGPAAPKAPRVRKRKADTEKKQLERPVYEPVMGSTGMMMEEGMYTQDYGFAYGNQPQFSQESASSPFVGGQNCSTPQPPMMMRPPIPPQGVPPSAAGMPPPSQGPPQGQMGPAPTPLEFRIHDMNRRIYTFNTSGISENDHKQWFEAFAHEFFDDEAVLWICFPEDQGFPPERTPIVRSLIPRFFLTFMENAVNNMYYVLRGPTSENQNPQTGLIHFENNNVLQVLRSDVHGSSIQVEGECKLIIEFTPYDELLNHRIKVWTMEMRCCREYTVNELTKEMQPFDLGKNTTRLGFPSRTCDFMRMARVLEPMQLLMMQSKTHHVTDPKDLLRRTLFQHQAKMAEMTRLNTPMIPPTPVEEQKPKPQRKRQRKPPANSKAKKANASPAPSNPSFPTNPMQGNFNAMGYQDVMVVGEPSMMGGDYGEEDERTISRVENTQYDPNALQMQQAAMSSMGSGMMPPGSLPPGATPLGHMPHPNGLPQHGMPGGLPPGHPPQMAQMGPPTNGMPPPYAFGQPPSQWPNQPNTTMITG